MKRIYTLMALIGALFMAATAYATPATDELFARYKSEGATGFDAARGQKNWDKEGKGEGGEMMSCSTCHGDDLSKDRQASQDQGRSSSRWLPAPTRSA